MHKSTHLNLIIYYTDWPHFSFNKQLCYSLRACYGHLIQLTPIMLTFILIYMKSQTLNLSFVAVLHGW